jgi:hypothetical protein
MSAMSTGRSRYSHSAGSRYSYGQRRSIGLPSIIRSLSLSSTPNNFYQPVFAQPSSPHTYDEKAGRRYNSEHNVFGVEEYLFH